METTRQAHEEKMRTQLDEWRARIDSLAANAATAAADAKVELEKVVGELRDLEASAKKHFEELAAASVEDWGIVRTALHDTWAKVGSAVDATRTRWPDRIEPSKHEHKKQ
jgi:hypothetical protein